MTTKREIILNDTIQAFGFEHPYTIEIFAISERMPEPEYDDTLLYLYSKRVADEIMREDPFEDDPVYENEDWDDFEEDVDESGFDVYMGCYTWDC